MKIVGHRGARGLAPENTIASLQKALEHHVDMLEFDLRVTKDGVVVLHHDAQLSDASGSKLLIKVQPFEKLKSHKPDMATFANALDTIGHPVPLYVEVKRGEPLQPIISILKRYLAKGWKSEYFMLGSKSQKTLLALHRDFPEITKIVIEPWSGVRASWRARQLDTDHVAMNQLWLWPGFIRAVARSNKKLYAYTLNDPVKAKRWVKHGLYGVITDYPDRFEER